MLDERKKGIILAMADYGMNVSEVSRQMYLHRNTTEYQCMQIHKKTGLNPKNFYDLIKLVEMVKAGET